MWQAFLGPSKLQGSWSNLELNPILLLSLKNLWRLAKISTLDKCCKTLTKQQLKQTKKT
jgi:hypothetical protein